MNWKLLNKADYVTTSWSGGTTTPLAIAPEGAVDAGRDFLWPLRPAPGEPDPPDLPPPADHPRFPAVLEGEIKLKNNGDQPFPLAPGRVVEFDGGVPVESWGQCVDFNLMVRKGQGQGAVSALTGNCETNWLTGPGDLAVYCASGTVRLPDFGVEAKAGQLLLGLGAPDGPVKVICESGSAMLASVKGV